MTIGLPQSQDSDFTQAAHSSPLPLAPSFARKASQESYNISGSISDSTRPQFAATQLQGLFNTRADLADMEVDPQLSESVTSEPQTLVPSRGGTLKKRNSLKHASSLRRSNSRKSLTAGSVRSLRLGDNEKYEGSDLYSAFFTPVPTKGNPTDVLANRFQEWRRVLKDLISYYREVQKFHETKAKSLLSLANVGSNLTYPHGFLKEGGISEALAILSRHNKHAVAEANKAKNIEEDIIVQLTGLRSDLAQKVKEIKNLSGDFKNSVDKESESTRKAISQLQDALGLVDRDGLTTGKGDPYIVKLAVERQIERQIDEENYLHKAFLNLENSGRELESIVVGEIQKAHNAYAGILKREADEAYETVEQLKAGPIAMTRDHEWNFFITDNESFVDPRMPVRNVNQITYPGRDAPAAAEVRSGMLERKSKYLKSYTPGWYVLSPTHLHEFKSADRICEQTPVMSLYLHDQKLGSHSQTDSSSHKFMLKGRQTGGMHRGHGWVFRAESRDTMLAWYDDIKSLNEKTGMERDTYVRRHARSMSQGSMSGPRSAAGSSDGGMDEDEADHVPFSPVASHVETNPPMKKMAERPKPGGRFPSDINVQRGLQVPLSPSSGTSLDSRDAISAANALPGSTTSAKGLGHTSTEQQTKKQDPTAAQSDGIDRQDTAGINVVRQAEHTPVHKESITPVLETAKQSEPPVEDEQIQTPDVLVADPPATKEATPLPEPATQASQATDNLGEADTENSELVPTPPVTEIERPFIINAAPSSTTNGLLQPTLSRTVSETPTQASVMTIMSHSTVEAPIHPKPPFVSQNSVLTISDLHVPGEFPRNAK